MANSKSDVQYAPDDVSRPLPFEDRACIEKRTSIKYYHRPNKFIDAILSEVVTVFVML